MGTVAYGTGAAGWLAAGLSSTQAPATLTLIPVLSALTAGTYSATVPVTAGTASNSPQNVTVTFIVAAAPPPPPPPGTTVPIVLAGNLGACGSELAKESAKVIAAAHPDYVFVLGHNISGPSAGKPPRAAAARHGSTPRCRATGTASGALRLLHMEGLTS